MIRYMHKRNKTQIYYSIQKKRSYIMINVMRIFLVLSNNLIFRDIIFYKFQNFKKGGRIRSCQKLVKLIFYVGLKN